MRISTVRVSSYGSIRLVPDPRMVNVIADWSDVRSPARAARRRRQGHPQRIRYREIPKPEFYHLPAENMIVAHPQTLAKLQERLSNDMTRRRDEELLNALMGRRR